MMGPRGERTSPTKPPTVPTIPAKFKAGLINFDSPDNAELFFSILIFVYYSYLINLNHLPSRHRLLSSEDHQTLAQNNDYYQKHLL